MKAFRNLPGFLNSYVIGQHGVERRGKPVRRDGRRRVKDGDITCRVHAGVRPAGAGHFDRLAGERPDRLIQCSFYRLSTGLPLPAAVITAVIRDREFDPAGAGG